MSVLVLIADGEPKRLERMRRLVVGEGAKAVTASDANDAMRLFIGREPDLTLLCLDPLGGFDTQLCHLMKTLDCGHPRSVVVIADRAARSAAFHAGCDAFVARSPDGQFLLGAVRRFLAVHKRPQRTRAIELSP